MTKPHPPTTDDVVDVLTRRRLDAGLSERELALRADIAIGTYFRRLRGDGRTFTFDEFARLALALDVTPSTLMQEAEERAESRTATAAAS